MSSWGSYAPNPHEGGRSEYYAMLALSSLGTSVAVPRQEDNGLDIYCTLADGDSKRAWADAYYVVQVKSDEKPWVFNQERSVKALMQVPLPLFLCIVKKKQQRFRVYHTSPRFYVWAHPPYPSQVRLLPGEPGTGVCTQWDDSEKFDLSAPILEFGVQEIEEQGFRENAKTILKTWINYDFENLYRLKTGILQFTMPYSYETNKAAIQGGHVTQGVTRADREHLEQVIPRFIETLAWVCRQLHHQGDLKGAVRACLLLRHLEGKDVNWAAASLAEFHSKLNDLLGGAEGKGYFFAGIDAMSKLVDETIDAAIAEFSTRDI
jgi:hypothetical protein